MPFPRLVPSSAPCSRFAAPWLHAVRARAHLTHQSIHAAALGTVHHPEPQRIAPPSPPSCGYKKPLASPCPFHLVLVSVAKNHRASRCTAIVALPSWTHWNFFLPIAGQLELLCRHLLLSAPRTNSSRLQLPLGTLNLHQPPTEAPRRPGPPPP